MNCTQKQIRNQHSSSKKGDPHANWNFKLYGPLPFQPTEASVCSSGAALRTACYSSPNGRWLGYRWQREGQVGPDKGISGAQSAILYLGRISARVITNGILLSIIKKEFGNLPWPFFISDFQSDNRPNKDEFMTLKEFHLIKFTVTDFEGKMLLYANTSVFSIIINSLPQCVEVIQLYSKYYGNTINIIPIG